MTYKGQQVPPVYVDVIFSASNECKVHRRLVLPTPLLRFHLADCFFELDSLAALMKEKRAAQRER
jgi:hypothetical protein